jgi:hypothetical protein
MAYYTAVVMILLLIGYMYAAIRFEAASIEFCGHCRMPDCAYPRGCVDLIDHSISISRGQMSLNFSVEILIGKVMNNIYFVHICLRMYYTIVHS